MAYYAILQTQTIPRQLFVLFLQSRNIFTALFYNQLPKWFIMLYNPPIVSPKTNASGCTLIPPSPEIVYQQFQNWIDTLNQGPAQEIITEDRLNYYYKRWQEDGDTTFLRYYVKWVKFYKAWESSLRAPSLAPGLDDNFIEGVSVDSKLITRPKCNQQLHKKTVHLLVLLVKFQDTPANPDLPDPEDYEKLFFTANDGTVSVSEYFRRASNFHLDPQKNRGVDIQGTVYPVWLELPKNKAYYAHHSNDHKGYGTDINAYPKNAQGLARAAVEAAEKARIESIGTNNKIDKIDFSKFRPQNENEDHFTWLCIVQAGEGAENTGDKKDLWSLKWTIKKAEEEDPYPTLAGIPVKTFALVPRNCTLGVCAHELGHLIAQWGDYYDPGWDGGRRSAVLGKFCLMAYGFRGRDNNGPVLPNGMLRLFHKWMDPIKIPNDQAKREGNDQVYKDISIKPASEGGSIVVIRHPVLMDNGQYIYVEYRRWTGQDEFVPDQGVAIYIVDERIPHVLDEKKHLAIRLLQADRQNNLNTALDGLKNKGDENDLYPHMDNYRIGKKTKPPLKVPNLDQPPRSSKWSGVTIEINKAKAFAPGRDEMKISVTLHDVPHS